MAKQPKRTVPRGAGPKGGRLAPVEYTQPIEVLTDPDYPNRELTKREAQTLQLQKAENNLFAQSLSIMQGALSFCDIKPGQTETPQEWIDLYGKEEADRRFLAASYSMMNKKDAPMGLTLALSAATTIIKARATEKAAPKSLNLTMVKMVAPAQPYDVIDIEDNT